MSIRVGYDTNVLLQNTLVVSLSLSLSLVGYGTNGLVTFAPVDLFIDFSHLYPKTERRKNRAGVLNGISISQDPDVLYITGKNWDKMFLIKLLF